MSTYPEKKSLQVETKEIIKSSTNSFLLTTRTSPTSVMVYIGGIYKYCIECQVFPNNQVAVLSKIEYDEKCSLSGHYERGTDTLTIISLVIGYIHDKFPLVKQLMFDDYSSRECKEKCHIDLASFYYALYGETWYMKKMGATFMKEIDKVKFQKAHETFQKSKEISRWEDLDQFVNYNYPIPVETVQKLFQESTTWTAFFSSLRDEVNDISKLCVFMQSWISTFIRNNDGLIFTSYKFTILIPSSVIPNTAYTILPYVKGGRRQTRRVWRRKKAVDLR